MVGDAPRLRGRRDLRTWAQPPARPPLASARYAEWLDDVLDTVNVERAAFVAVSLGGRLALDYAIRRPERVERLALLAPDGVGRQRLEILLVARLLMALGGGRGRRAALRLALGPIPVPSTPSAQSFAAFVDLIWRHFRPRTERLPRFDGDQLDRLDLPLLAILGANDGLLDSRDASRRLRRHCPSAHIVLLPDAGHLLLGQTQRIQDFLDGAP
jgi:pimeloyl-ACP methyl ester carboxylesterase